MLIVAAAIVLVLGLVGLLVSLRGRRVDDHPICRRCGFDLIGVYPGRTVCPECGRALAMEGGAEKPRAIRIGNRRRRSGWVATWSALVLLACVAGGLIVWDAKQAGGWNAHKPTWWLMMDTSSGTTTTVDAALKELKVRRALGKLSEAQKKTLIERGLAWQADMNKAWIDAWGEVVEDAWAKGALSDEQKKAYAQHAASVTLQARPVVRKGDRVAASVLMMPRVGSAGLFSFQLDLGSMKLGKQELLGMPFAATGALDPQPGWPASGVPPGMLMEVAPEVEPDVPEEVHTVIVTDHDAVVNLAPGAYTLHAPWALKIGEREPGTAGGGWSWGRSDPRYMAFGLFGKKTFKPLAEQKFDLTAPVRVVGAAEETVKLVTDERLSNAVQSAVTVSIFDQPAMPFSPARRVVSLSFGAAPIDLAFDVTVRCGGKEKHGSAVAKVGPLGRTSQLQAPPDDKGALYEVVLTPSADRARRTLGMTRIWGKELVFKNLAVQKPPTYFGSGIAVGGAGPGSGGSDTGVAVMASLKLPPGDRFPGNHAFRSVALALPMVYVGDRAGDVYVFKVDEEDRDASKDPVRVVKKVGDGNDLKVIGGVLVTSRRGSLATCSLKNPDAPEPLGTFGPVQKFTSESLVVSGDRVYVLGRGAIRCFNVSDPTTPSMITSQTVPDWPRAGCIRGNRLYAVELGGGTGPSKIGVYDLSEVSDIQRIGGVEVSPTPCALYPLGEDRILAVLDAPTTSLSGPGPWGSTAILDVKDGTRPRVVATHPGTGGRASAMLTAGDGKIYLAVPGAVMRVEKDELETVMPLYTGSANLDGAAYHGAADATHLAVVTDDVVVVVRIVPPKENAGSDATGTPGER